MKKIAYILASAAAVLVATGCSDSFDAREASGEGRIILRTSIDAEMKPVSRAITADDADALGQSCQIWISSDRGLVRKYDGIQNVPVGGVWLAGGAYTAEAWAGDSVPASFDQRYFKGTEPFNISAGQTVQVNLVCRVVNVAASIKYAASVDEVLSNYTMTVYHDTPNGSLVFEGRDERRGYFMMNSRNTDLKYTFKGTKVDDGSEFVKEGVITAVKPATEYVLNVNYEGGDLEMGGGFFTIDVDETPLLEDTKEIQIIPAPQIVGVYQPLTETVIGEIGNVGRQKIYVAAAAELSQVEITFPAELSQNLGLDYNRVNLVATTELDNLAALGLRTVADHDIESDTYSLMINLESEFLNKLPEGESEISVTASVKIDEDGVTKTKSNTGIMKFNISDATVEADPVDPYATTTWARQADITGTVMKDGATGIGFNYRAVSGSRAAGDWTFVPAEGIDPATPVAKGTPYKATLTGLQPGTTYEYVAVSGDFVSANINTFTTEEATQLPNSGFEDWYMDGKIQRICANADEMFWDSGNKGSATVNTTLTMPCENPKHGGLYSAELRSKKVAIAFAAGNLFAGEFLGTESLTKGILGWGRSWTSRPQALKGYIKYVPQPISDISGVPDGVTVNKGDMDAGIIYIAIVDNSTMTYGKYSGWPQIVATKDLNSYGFKSSASNVIAYGEKIFTEATAGDGLIEFEIPLEYFKTDVKAANIIVVASASRYGDYYTGGAESVMYLDDLELVY